MQPAKERLRELKEALLLGDPVDEGMRFELVGLLEYIVATLPKPRGRPESQALRMRAGVVGVLHTKHGMKLELALNVVSRGDDEEERARDRDRLRYAYRRLAQSGESVKVPERMVIHTLAMGAKFG